MRFPLFLLLLLTIPSSFIYAEENISMFLEPAGGDLVVGSTFDVSVFINTGDKAINAVEVDLKFSPDKLQVVSPTSGVSFFKIWLGTPNYSNVNGTINLKGGIPSPGIVSTKGLITSITFRAKSTGQASILFTDQSKILADDGKATDVLTKKSGATFNLRLPPPEGPSISSPTHTDQGKWHKNSSPLFIWNKEENVTGFSYIINKNAIDTPDEIVDGSNARVQYKNLSDGLWFFHIKSYSDHSGWGGVSHYQVFIDSTPPAKFPITVEPRARTINPEPTIKFLTTDNVSGIDHYELSTLRVDGKSLLNNSVPFFIEVGSPYRMPMLEKGAYDIIIRAYDRAGNFQDSTEKLEIVSYMWGPFGRLGFGMGGILVVNWTIFWTMAGLFLLILLFMARHFWVQHRKVSGRLNSGIWNWPHKAVLDLEKLKNLQQRYHK